MIGEFNLAERVAEWIEVLAIFVIAASVVIAVVQGVRDQIENDLSTAFTTFKASMARGLLVGLDLLIAADIIKTVTLEPTLENVVVLGLLVMIRTFLSWALVVEIEGRWPWQQPLPQEPA